MVNAKFNQAFNISHVLIFILHILLTMNHVKYDKFDVQQINLLTYRRCVNNVALKFI